VSHHQPLELSIEPGAGTAGLRRGRGQHGHPQAFGVHAAHQSCRGRDHRRRVPQGRSGRRRRRGGRRHRPARASFRSRLLHRLAGGGQEGHGGRGRQPRLGDTRAGWQIARHRGRQRGPARRRRAHHLGQDGERRPDLHRAGLRVRAPRRGRPVRRVVPQHHRAALRRDRCTGAQQPRLPAHDPSPARRARGRPHRRCRTIRRKAGLRPSPSPWWCRCRRAPRST